MLRKPPAAAEDDAAVYAYLREILGVEPGLHAWAEQGKLPYFLQDAYSVRELTLLDRRMLLAIDQRLTRPSLVDVRVQVEKLRQIAGVPVVYVTQSLASYERRRLIELKVPFLVPGNQLYLPEIGIDLREYFRRPTVEAKAALSPATQAMLISVLMRDPWRAQWQPAEVVGQLGYTAMTLSRAVQETTAAGIAALRTEGRVRWLRTERTAAEAWEHMRPMLRSPIKRRIWARPIPESQAPHGRLAGLSALARFSMLAEPTWPTYAISAAQWKTATTAGLEILPEPLPGACEWEVWHYDPALVPASDTVDPLSLTLSLQDDTDERIQLALDELRAHFPW